MQKTNVRPFLPTSIALFLILALCLGATRQGVVVSCAFANVKDESKDSDKGNSSKSDSMSSGRNSRRPYLNSPFNGTIFRVDPRFKGHDPSKIYEAISNNSKFKNLKRDSFESEKTFIKRFKEFRRELQTEPLYGSLDFSSPISFVCANISVTYKPDSELLTVVPIVKGGFSTSKYAGSITYWGVENRSSSIALDSVHHYMLGIEADKKESDVHVFDCHNYAITSDVGYQMTDWSWTLGKVKPKVARHLMESIRVLCVGKIGFLQEPGYSTFDVHGAQTRVICLRNIQLWIYDNETGSVLAKFAPEESGGWFCTTPIKPVRAIAANEIVNAYEPSDKISVRSSLTWDEVYAGYSRDGHKAAWETSKPTIVVPDDANSLFDAIKLASKSEQENPTILLKDARAQLGATLLETQITIKKPMTIRSDSDKPVVIDFKRGTAIVIDSCNVNFKNIDFQRSKGPIGVLKGSGDSPVREPLVSISSKDKIEVAFKDCLFDGDFSERSVGIAALDGNVRLKLSNCQFTHFDKCALYLTDSAFASIDYSSFGEKNMLGIDANEGNFEIEKCHFFDNTTAIKGTGYLSGNVDLSFFHNNEDDVLYKTSFYNIEVTRKNGALK